MNVTEIRDSDFKNAFPVIFNFTVEILTESLEITHGMLNEWTDDRYKSFNFNWRIIEFKVSSTQQRNPFTTEDLDRTFAYFFRSIFPNNFEHENVKSSISKISIERG